MDINWSKLGDGIGICETVEAHEIVYQKSRYVKCSSVKLKSAQLCKNAEYFDEPSPQKA